jgi:hypothetical protein
MAQRQLIGVALAVALIAATALWVAAGRPFPDPLHTEVKSEIVIPATEPDAVRAARQLLASAPAGEWPAQIRAGERHLAVHSLGPAALLCLPDHSCALVRHGSRRILYRPGPGAERVLRRAAREGEPKK